MRILVYLHSFELGGVERVALRLAGEWAAQKHFVCVAMGRDTGPQRHHAPGSVLYDFARPSRLAAPFETLWMVFHLLGAIRRHRPDVLFCAGSTYTIVAFLVRIVLGGRCPPTVCKLSNSLERRDLRAPVRAVFSIWLRLHPFFIERFVGMSGPMRHEIECCLMVPPERVDVVPDPVLSGAEWQLLRDSPAPPRSPERRFVAVGRFNAQKNFRLLLDAFAEFAGPDDRLLLVGDGPQRRHLLEHARGLGISDRVSMPGYVMSAAEALAGNDVLVVSSNYEGVPAVLIEGLAAGIPIIATDCSASMRYLLKDGAFGTLVPVRDRKALASAMATAPARDAVPAEAMREMAAQFSLERGAALYLETLSAAVSSWKTRPFDSKRPYGIETRRERRRT